LSNQAVRKLVGAHENVPDDSSPNTDAEADWIVTRIARGLPRTQRWLLWTLNTTSRLKHASSVHRMSCEGLIHGVQMSQPFAKLSA
jgi:hypothetical protein